MQWHQGKCSKWLQIVLDFTFGISKCNNYLLNHLCNSSTFRDIHIIYTKLQKAIKNFGWISSMRRKLWRNIFVCLRVKCSVFIIELENCDDGFYVNMIPSDVLYYTSKFVHNVCILYTEMPGIPKHINQWFKIKIVDLVKLNFFKKSSLCVLNSHSLLSYFVMSERNKRCKYRISTKIYLRKEKKNPLTIRKQSDW